MRSPNILKSLFLLVIGTASLSFASHQSFLNKHAGTSGALKGIPGNRDSCRYQADQKFYDLRPLNPEVKIGRAHV